MLRYSAVDSCLQCSSIMVCSGRAGSLASCGDWFLGYLQITGLDEEFLEAVVQVQRLQRRRRNLKTVLQKLQVRCTASFSNNCAGIGNCCTACLNLSGLM